MAMFNSYLSHYQRVLSISRYCDRPKAWFYSNHMFKWGPEMLASGKHTESYWKWRIYSWFAHVIFHDFVSLPDGTCTSNNQIHEYFPPLKKVNSIHNANILQYLHYLHIWQYATTMIYSTTIPYANLDTSVCPLIYDHMYPPVIKGCTWTSTRNWGAKRKNTYQ